jgi:lipopolysaccharide/colanic/teichoic acid biosynthesis glycosyltransferase
MYADSLPYAETARLADDPRVTPLGRILRLVDLDELPQLFNVLLGRMSMVGPRPEMPQIVAAYNELQRLRLSMKPGMTGLWQVSPDRNQPIHENLDYDLYYIENRSIVLDVIILLDTLFYMIVKAMPFVRHPARKGQG